MGSGLVTGEQEKEKVTTILNKMTRKMETTSTKKGHLRGETRSEQREV